MDNHRENGVGSNMEQVVLHVNWICGKLSTAFEICRGSVYTFYQLWI